MNPHGSMTITVKNPDGSTTDWTFTTGSATTLAGSGGISARARSRRARRSPAKFIPARNGNPLGFLKTVTTANGKVFQVLAGNPND